MLCKRLCIAFAEIQNNILLLLEHQHYLLFIKNYTQVDILLRAPAHEASRGAG